MVGGNRLDVTDVLSVDDPIEAVFTGTFTDARAEPVEFTGQQRVGASHTPTWFGKTIVACAPVAHGACRAAIFHPQICMASRRALGMPVA